MTWHVKYFPLLALFVIAFSQGCDPSTSDSVVQTNEETDSSAIVINVPDGFELEELYVPSDHNMGTWVSLAEDDQGRMYAGDQHGHIYMFKIPKIGEKLDSTQVDSIEAQIGHAHGMLWAHNSLYVSVNKKWTDTTEVGSGIYRLFDQNGNGNPDELHMLLRLEGQGEHGPHSFILGPMGKKIYFIAGNHTDVPKELANNSRLPNVWKEDNLLPSYVDARGHATDREAPGGWICSMDADGDGLELIAAGFRNAFDIGMNDQWELFAFDADMEWDFGMPWYRPIRICHAVSGAEFGWRTGTGKWPTYYPDALPSVIDLGQGSPTAVLMTGNLKFPQKYRHGMFVADWSFGTLYFIDLVPDGGSYRGTKEEFLSGIPFPLTDVIAGRDGHMYIATGGRDLESHFYRLRYVGNDESTIPGRETRETVLFRQIRRELETLHDGPKPVAVEKAWEHLDHQDRFVRYAARIALEHQPVKEWEKKVMEESIPVKTISGIIALSRMGNKRSRDAMLRKLITVDWANLSESQTLDKLRAYELILHRMSSPGVKMTAEVVADVQKIFPSESNAVNREASEILIYLEDEEATRQALHLMIQHTDANTTLEVAMLDDEVSSRHERYGKVVKEVIANMPPAEAIFYAVRLSHAEKGWTDGMREQYFQWFFDVMGAKGGMSFKAFMENIRIAALEHVPKQQREHYQELSGVFSPTEELANLPKPKGPGDAYNMSDIGKILRENLKKEYQGSIEDGRRAFEAALCSSCHRMGAEGGISGPDLSQINTRFKQRDIVSAIFQPSDAISDQYAFTLFTLKSGEKKAGRIFSEDDDKVIIMPNPYSSTIKEEILMADVVEQGPSPISPMPPGLLNPLNKQEIADLFAYLLSGADEDYFYYGGTKGLEDEVSD
ncbi:MAG: c-type cytochrome [Saprospiraceae bacterium]|nr:c-type cytochrome [Saprospiraceae bacterium]